MEQTSFGALLRQYRLRTRDPLTKRFTYLTLERLGMLLQQRLGRAPRLNTISAWENGISRPHPERRSLLCALIGVLKAYGGINELKEADALLVAGGYAPLSPAEVAELGWAVPAPTSPKNRLVPELEETTTNRSEQLLSRLPRQDYIQFVGRKETLALLQRALLQDDGFPFVVVQDAGGRGKTALAQRAIRTMISSAPWSDIIWISARGEKLNSKGELTPTRDGAQSVTEVMNRLVACLGNEKLVGQPVRQQVQAIARRLLNDAYLIVVDNLEQINESETLIELLGELAGGKTRFLITTRYSLESHPLAQIIRLPDLSYEESRTLVNIELTRRGYPPIHEQAPNEMQRLYELVGGTPLMLRMAAGLRFRYSWNDIFLLLSDQPTQAQERLYNVFFRHVWTKVLSEDARDLLLTMTDLVSTGASETWVQVTSGLDGERFDSALRQLLSTLLIQAQRDVENRYSLHSLLRTYLNARLASQEVEQSSARYFERLVARLQTVLDVYADEPDRLREEVESLFSLLSRGLSTPPARLTAMQLLLRVHPLPLYWNYADQWERLIEPAIGLSEQDEHLRLLLPSLLGCWADVLHSTGRYSLAAESCLRALQLCQEAGLNPLEREVAYFRAAAVGISSLVDLGRLEEAVEQRAQAQQRLDDLAPELLITPLLEQIAHFRQVSVALTRRLKTPADAVAEGRGLLDWLEKIPGIGVRVRANAYHHFAIANWALGEYGQVVDSLKTVLQLYQQSHNQVPEGEAWGNLGLVYWSMGWLVEAEEATLRFLKMVEQFNLRPRYIKACGNLALVYVCQKRLDEALYYVDLQIEQARQIDFDREVARGVGNRGTILLHRGEYQGALEALREDEAYCRANRLVEGLGNTMVNLGLCLWLQGQREQSVHYAEAALRVANEHQLKALKLISLRLLGIVTSDQAKARKLLEEALTIAQQSGRQLDEAACLLSLACLNMDDRNSLWAAGAALLSKMNASGWLEGHSPEQPPLLPMIT
jgi:tetratricopeptide (TPR) repeat protein